MAVVHHFHISPGYLASALNELAHQAGIELLFSTSVVGDRRVPALNGQFTPAEALRKLLSSTGLYFRVTADGSCVVFTAADSGTNSVEDVAVPEILVIGRRTQSADIRRTEDDIQPYRVQTSREIESSHADNADDFLRTRLPSNAELVSPTQTPAGLGVSTRSEVDLHGLGVSQTLVLVDGRRMPSLATNRGGFLQPDLNGIPLSAIDRIETLTSTAGGIYGPGATGGVVNVILKRDYQGADLDVRYGESTRGDALRGEIDGRIGFTPDGGRTDVSLSFSRMVSSTLRGGDRDYADQSRLRQSSNDPGEFLQNTPTANAVIIQGLGLLTLKPALGGAALNSTITFLPVGSTGAASDGGAALRGNAGMIPLALAPDGSGSRQSLISSPSVTSILFNARHRFSDNAEAFIDVMDLQNDARATTTAALHTLDVYPNSPGNPFRQFLQVTVPLPGFDLSATTRTRETRVSGGIIVKLPYRWKADIDYSWGAAKQDARMVGTDLNSDAGASSAYGQPGAHGERTLNPLGNWATFQAAIQDYRQPVSIDVPLLNRLSDSSLRLAGPIADLPGGPLSLSLLAEDRHEEAPAAEFTSVNYSSNGTTTGSLPRLRQQIKSFYGEVRAPLVAMTSRIAPLRGLELQLAVRNDRIRTILPADVLASAVNATFVSSHDQATVYTAGVRLRPSKIIMLRSSIATGVLPPSIDQLGSRSVTFHGSFGVGDPKRGGNLFGTEVPITLLYGGSTSLRPERARSLSVGAVITPAGETGPRLSLDFARIDKSGEISAAHIFDVAYFVANEAAFPGRIVRAQLTAKDAALGYTGGIITQVDTTNLNIGSSVVETLDVQLDYPFRLGTLGSVRLYGSATWQPVFKRRDSPDHPWSSLVGYLDGPLEWRGNAGAEWSRGPTSVSVNGQYYDHYRVTASTVLDDTTNVMSQGAAWISAQFYIDLAASYRLSLPGLRSVPRTVEIRFGIQDLLDKRPPTIAIANTDGYSYYGDPRRRRFEVVLASRF